MTRLLGALLSVACLVVAGCLDAGDSAAERPAVSPSSAIPASILVGKGGDAETSITVSSDGQVVLACAHGGFTKPSPLWASQDGGATFRQLEPQPNPVPSGDCDVAITDDGDWYIVYDTLASATVAASSDQGRTWRFHYVAAPPVGVVDRPWLLAVGNTVLLTYADLMAGMPFVLMLTRSVDGGRTWSPPTPVASVESTDGSYCFQGHLIGRDAGRILHLPVNCRASNAYAGFVGVTSPETLFLLSSDDSGASWVKREVSAAEDPSSIPTAAYAGDDALWLTYGSAARDGEVHALLSTDDGRTWSAPLFVAPEDASWPWVDGRPDGSASIAWLHNAPPADASSAENWWQVSLAHVRAHPSPTLESHRAIAEPYQGFQILEFLSVDHDPDGRALVLYPMAGEGCSVPGEVPALPDPLGPPRNTQCVHLVIDAP